MQSINKNQKRSNIENIVSEIYGQCGPVPPKNPPVQSKNDIDIVLAKFFFGCNIPFKVIESIHFKNLIAALNPYYHLPGRKFLSNNLLNKVHEEIVTERKKHLENNDCVLLIDGWKNSAANSKHVVCTIHNADYNRQFFIESYDITGRSENAELLLEVVNSAIELSKDLCSTNIFAIVSDNASPMISMGNRSNLWYSTCNSHSGNLLAKSLVDGEFANEVNALLKEFKNPGLQRDIVNKGGSKIKLACETRWSSYRDAFKCTLQNLNIMRNIASTASYPLKARVLELLQDQKFELKLKQYVEILNPVCMLINKCQSSTCNVADATQLWLTLTIPSTDEFHKHLLTERLKKAIRPIGMAANLVHPSSQGEKLSAEQLERALQFLNGELNQEGINELDAYLYKTGIFFKLFNKKITDPHVFWAMCERRVPNLSALAKKLLKIPASSAELERLFSNWSFVHSFLRNRLLNEKSKKLVDIYYTLKTMEKHSELCQNNVFLDPFD